MPHPWKTKNRGNLSRSPNRKERSIRSFWRRRILDNRRKSKGPSRRRTKGCSLVPLRYWDRARSSPTSKRAPACHRLEHMHVARLFHIAKDAPTLGQELDSTKGTGRAGIVAEKLDMRRSPGGTSGWLAFISQLTTAAGRMHLPMDLFSVSRQNHRPAKTRVTAFCLSGARVSR